MEQNYELVIVNDTGEQSPNDLSFVGGRPRIPKDIEIPRCKLCGNDQAFFFQVAFPANHKWASKSMAVFACISCVDEKYFIPPMINGPLHNALIPEGFLDEYQKNFNILVFQNDDAETRDDYPEKVVFKNILMHKIIDNNDSFMKLGVEASWYLNDESPAKYGDGNEFFFLMQLPEDLEFEIIPGSPGQMKLDYFSNQIMPSNESFYRLFLANYLYFFGVNSISGNKVYIFTQI